jgi:hypothetical protein
MSDTPLIYGKIATVMAEVEPIAKNQSAPGLKYNFRGVEAVYNTVQPILARNKVFTSPEILDHQYHVTTVEKQNNGGKYTQEVARVVLKVRVRFYAEDGSSISADVMGEGMDYGDKACNKAMSVAHKYAVLQVLMIPTELTIDPESDPAIGRGPADEEDVRETAISMLKKKFLLGGIVTHEQKDAVIRYLTDGRLTLDTTIKNHDAMQELLRAWGRDKDITTLLERAQA